MRVTESGGKPETIISVKDGETADGPRLLPDGRTLLFSITSDGGIDRWDKARIVVQTIGATDRKVLIEGGSDGRYLPTGHLVYAAGGTLFAAPFDVRRMATTGGPVPVIEGIKRAGNPEVNTGIAHFSVADNGSLVYIAGPASTAFVPRALVRLDRKGNVETLNVPQGPYDFPRVSPDGRRVAFESNDGKDASVWIYDLDGASSMRRLTFGGRKRIGTTRVVIVTPRNYATRNDATVDAVRQLGPNARGVAVLRPTVTSAELKRLHDAGIRGIRFSVSDPAASVVSFDMVEPLARRVADLGWHVQFGILGEQIVEREALLRRLPSAMVFDHLGRPPLPASVEHRSHRIVRDLIDRGRTWVKLSGAYLNTRVGPPYPEATQIAQAFAKAAPERMVWGSDWPHPSEAPGHKPNDAVLFDLLSVWTPDAATRRRILVENPATLYGFAKSS